MHVKKGVCQCFGHLPQKTRYIMHSKSCFRKSGFSSLETILRLI